MSALPAGLILTIALSVGLAVIGNGDKRRLRCPFHDDQTPSAFISLTSNVFYCSVCCGHDGRGWTAKRFAQELGVPWRPQGNALDTPVSRHRSSATFTAHDAQAVYELSLARSRSDDEQFIKEDRPAYRYLHRRGLAETWDLSLFGTLGPGMDLPTAVAWWTTASYRLVVPLYDAVGDIMCIQGRAIDDCRRPKTMTPGGGKIAGTAFANRQGIAVLRGDCHDRVVLVGEGLTDFLCLGLVSPASVLASPGAAVTRHMIGPWAKNCIVCLALDRDKAGDDSARAAARAVRRQGGRPFRATWPGGAHDACDALEQYGIETLSEFIAHQVSRCTCV